MFWQPWPGKVEVDIFGNSNHDWLSQQHSNNKLIFSCPAPVRSIVQWGCWMYSFTQRKKGFLVFWQIKSCNFISDQEFRLKYRALSALNVCLNNSDVKSNIYHPLQISALGRCMVWTNEKIDWKYLKTTTAALMMMMVACGPRVKSWQANIFYHFSCNQCQ